MELKRAEVRLPKHDSIVRIKENQAGRVAQNVQQINKSANSSGMEGSSEEQASQRSSQLQAPSSRYYYHSIVLMFEL